MNLARLLTDTVYASQPEATDVYGNPIWTEPAPIPCRYEGKMERAVSADTGTEVLSQAQFVTDQPVEVDWRIWPPGADPADEAQALRPVAVGFARDPAGSVTLYQVWL